MNVVGKESAPAAEVKTHMVIATKTYFFLHIDYFHVVLSILSIFFFFLLLPLVWIEKYIRLSSSLVASLSRVKN